MSYLWVIERRLTPRNGQNDNANPFLRGHYPVRLEAGERTRAHPLNFLPNRCEAVAVIISVRELKRYNLRLRALGTSQPTQMHMG